MYSLILWYHLPLSAMHVSLNFYARTWTARQSGTETQNNVSFVRESAQVYEICTIPTLVSGQEQQIFFPLGPGLTLHASCVCGVGVTSGALEPNQPISMIVGGEMA